MGAPDQTERDPIITLRVSPKLDDQIDDVWQERGYSSRSEFVRDAIRTAIDPQVTISEQFLEHLRVSQEQKESGESIALDELE